MNWYDCVLRTNMYWPGKLSYSETTDRIKWWLQTKRKQQKKRKEKKRNAAKKRKLQKIKKLKKNLIEWFHEVYCHDKLTLRRDEAIYLHVHQLTWMLCYLCQHEENNTNEIQKKTDFCHCYDFGSHLFIRTASHSRSIRCRINQVSLLSLPNYIPLLFVNISRAKLERTTGRQRIYKL